MLGEGNLLEAISGSWAADQIPPRNFRKTVNEVFAEVAGHTSVSAFFDRNPVYHSEVAVHRLIQEHADKFGWTDEEKQLAHALVAERIMNQRVTALRKLITAKKFAT